MSQENRKFTRDVDLFSFAPLNAAGQVGTPVSYLGTLRHTRVVRSVEELESRAAKDEGRFYRGGTLESTITASVAVEGNGTLVQYTGRHVEVVLKEHADLGAGTYRFIGLVSTTTHEFAEHGAQSEDITIHGGVMTKTTA